VSSRWLLAESGEDELVFRPEDYPLPLARGRQAIELRPDRTFTALAPGPDDRPVESSALDGWTVAEVAPDRVTLRRDPRLP
jgi:hypothetical protein